MIADSRHLPLKDQSINCIITSPPYWSLRKYDIPDLIWDGVEGCEHEWGRQLIKKTSNNFNSDFNERYGNASGQRKQEQSSYGEIKQGQFCIRCSAWRGQLGLEPTIDLYLKHLLQIMDECKRVLRDDGSLWVNIGDSYFGDSPVRKSAKEQFDPECQTVLKRTAGGDRRSAASINGLRAKSLCLIPERFAIEMVNLDWILRNKLIWHKPNCMPASVKDRFTVDFEPVFFFVKSRKYWFEQQYDKYTAPLDRWGGDNLVAKGQSSWDQGTGQTTYRDRSMRPNPQGRNRRCLWTMPTQPYPESHFATFPEDLIEPMIRAGCPKGGIVLDPFAGSGTTMRVAEKLNRIGIGFDLAYQNLQNKRMRFVQKELL